MATLKILVTGQRCGNDDDNKHNLLELANHHENVAFVTYAWDKRERTSLASPAIKHGNIVRSCHCGRFP